MRVRGPGRGMGEAKRVVRMTCFHRRSRDHYGAAVAGAAHALPRRVACVLTCLSEASSPGSRNRRVSSHASKPCAACTPGVISSTRRALSLGCSPRPAAPPHPKIISITRSGDIFETAVRAKAPADKGGISKHGQLNGWSATAAWGMNGKEQGPVHELASGTQRTQAQEYLSLAGLAPAAPPPRGLVGPTATQGGGRGLDLSPAQDLPAWSQGLGSGLLTTLGLKKADIEQAPPPAPAQHAFGLDAGLAGHVRGGGEPGRQLASTAPPPTVPAAGGPGVRWADGRDGRQLPGGRSSWWRTRDACLALQAELLPSAFSASPDKITQLAHSICSAGGTRAEDARAGIKGLLEQLSGSAMMDEFTRSQALVRPALCPSTCLLPGGAASASARLSASCSLASCLATRQRVGRLHCFACSCLPAAAAAAWLGSLTCAHGGMCLVGRVHGAAARG